MRSIAALVLFNLQPAATARSPKKTCAAAAQWHAVGSFDALEKDADPYRTGSKKPPSSVQQPVASKRAQAVY